MSSMNFPTIPRDLMDEILSCEAPFEDEEARESCELLLEELSEVDQEVIALTSYAYWVATLGAEKPSKEVQKRMALKEVRRHFVGSHGNEEVTRKSLKGSVDHRKKFNMHVIRSCYFTEFTYEKEEDAKIAETYRECIEADLSKQIIAVRGRDKENRPIVSVLERTEPPADVEAFLLTRIYILERSLAIAEVLSKGRNEKIVGVLDYGRYASSNAPSLTALKEIVIVLQYCYPERLKRLIVLDPPFWVRTAYNVIYPFLVEDTRQKFILATGDEQKREYLSEVVTPDQATTNLYPNGKLTTPTETTRFLREVPFHLLYDES